MEPGPIFPHSFGLAGTGRGPGFGGAFKASPLFGDERLRDVISTTADKPAAYVAQRIVQAALAFGGEPPADDSAVLVLKPAH